MTIAKQIAQALFKQQKKKLETKHQSPVLKPSIVSKRDPDKGKQKRRAKAPLETMIDIASKFTCNKLNNALGTIKLDTTSVQRGLRGRISIQATNIDSWFTGSTQKMGNDSTATQVCIDAKKAKAAVALPRGMFQGIRIGKRGANINDTYIPVGCNNKDYPPIPSSEDVATQKCKLYNILDLKQAIPFLAKAAGKANDTEGADNIFFDLKRGKLVATDGHRLHITPTGRMAHNPKYSGKDIMMQPSVSKIARVLSGDFQILQDRHVIFVVDIPGCKAEAGYRLIDGHFRKYEHVIPREFCGKYVASKAEMLHVLKQAMAKTSSNHPCIQLDFSKKDVRIELYKVNSGCNILYKQVFKASLHKGKYEGKNFTGSINPKFLYDAIYGMPDDKIEFSLPKNNGAAWVIKGIKSKYIAVIMPINIQI